MGLIFLIRAFKRRIANGRCCERVTFQIPFAPSMSRVSEGNGHESKKILLSMTLLLLLSLLFQACPAPDIGQIKVSFLFLPCLVLGFLALLVRCTIPFLLVGFLDFRLTIYLTLVILTPLITHMLTIMVGFLLLVFLVHLFLPFLRRGPEQQKE